jgi:hypothetical protein
MLGFVLLFFLFQFTPHKKGPGFESRPGVHFTEQFYEETKERPFKKYFNPNKESNKSAKEKPENIAKKSVWSHSLSLSISL